jgi:tetratricopeptide (TPR) repeat protein
VLRVRLYSENFYNLNKRTYTECVVPPPGPSGRFAEAQHLFDQFLQKSDIDAASKCVELYESMLADFHTDMPIHDSATAPLLCKLNDIELPIESHKEQHVLIQLARTLDERYRYTGDVRDLEYAAKHGKKALGLCRAMNMVCPMVSVFYADILVRSFEVNADSEELRMAEMLCLEAKSLCNAAHPSSSAVCHILSWINMRKFEQTSDKALLDEAVHLQLVGLKQLPETESKYRHRHLRCLADLLRKRQYHGQHQDTDDPLSIISEAFQLCPPMHIDKRLLYSRIIGQLTAEYNRSGDHGFMNRAIELGREALNMTVSPNAAREAYFLSLMADILLSRHTLAMTNNTDLEESVGLYRKALQLSVPSGVNHWVYVRGLARVLINQFLLDGNLDHLEEAIQLYYHASDNISKGNPFRPMIISGFGYSLGLRFRETGDISELNRAIDLDEQAVAALHPSARSYAGSTLQMLSHLCLRYEMLHGNDDLKNAVIVAEELLKSIPDGDINRLEAISILSKARLLYAVNQGNSGDIDLAVEQLLSIKQQLLQSTLGPESLRTLAACYMVKFRHSSIIDSALRAKDTVNELLEIVKPDHYERFQCLIDAAKLYMEHGTPYYNIDVALDYFSDALGNGHRDMRSKIRSAKYLLGKMETENHDIFTTRSFTSLRLLDIMGSAVSLLPRIAFFGIHPHSRLQSLTEGQSIAMNGASHALNLSLPEKALEIMEQGRAIFWTHTLRLRSPFDDIPNDLRDRLSSLARRLEKVTNASETSSKQHYIDREIAQRRKESDEFNFLVEEVRCLPGLEHFMLPEGYSTLKCVAEKGPVVVLVCSTLACHAIVLSPSGKASGILLKDITEKWLLESASVWRLTVIEARRAIRDGRKMVKQKGARDANHAQAEQILHLLWTNVVFPVIEALQIEVCMLYYSLKCRCLMYNIQPALERNRPRIWWCPTGHFAHLPVHAAGTDEKCCSDYFVSSYTPTISSLLNARKGCVPVKKQHIKALVVAVPQSSSPSWNELASTIEEVTIVKDALPNETLISVPSTDDTANNTGEVTANNLIDRLPEATILHLACHGSQDAENALRSGFVMSDEILTIERLMQIPLPRAFMAFLSACETAKGDQASTEADLINKVR